jgi:hypothetical protein
VPPNVYLSIDRGEFEEAKQATSNHGIDPELKRLEDPEENVIP